MKFNKIIMNPPYKNSLHLKIINKTLENCVKTNDCELVNLSPLLPFYEHFAYNRKTIINFNYCYTLKEKIFENDAEKLFNLSNIGSDLGIMKITTRVFDANKLKDSLFLNKRIIIDKLWSKISNMPKLNSQTVTYSKCKGPFILKFVYGLSLSNHGLKTKSSYNITSLNFSTASVGKESAHTRYVSFDSQEEQKNAHNVYCSDIMRFYYKEVLRGRCDYSLVPWFENYKKIISEDYLVNFFKLTQEELKIIKDDLKDFK